MKLAKIAIVLVLGSMEKKFTFSTLAFMKKKIMDNCLGQHLDARVHMFTQEIFFQENFPY
jgi:hypothetical protein